MPLDDGMLLDSSTLAPEPGGGALEPRPIDPSTCWLRHVRRTAAGETGTAIGAGTFIADPTSDLGGREGWQSGAIVFALSEDGEGTFRFPNAAGVDGRLHRRRFALLTDPAYRIGEEWLEVYRDADELVAVITPQTYSLSRAELVLKGPDVAGVLGRFRSLELEPWVGASPRDVIEHYTRAPILCAETDFRNLTGIPAAGAASGTTPEGIEYALGAGATTAAGPNGELVITAAAAASGLGLPAIEDAAADCWVIEARVRVVADPEPNGTLALNIWDETGNAFPHLQLELSLATGDATLAAGAPPDVTGGAPNVERRAGLVAVGSHALRLIAFYDRLLAFIDGELCGEVRRPAPFRLPARAQIVVENAAAVMDSMSARSLAPFAMRGADKGDLTLPGVPPAVGLRARLYNAAPIYARYTTTAARGCRLPELVGDEPAAERLDPTADLAAGAVAPTVAGAVAGVWTGAIFLDLEASDRRLRLTWSGAARLFVGKTRPGLDAAIDGWTGAGSPAQTAPLRSLIGPKSGWYPIRVELFASSAAAATLKLEDGAADAGGVVATYATVPRARLSPIGTYDELIRNESHREVLGQVAQTFGYQWRVNPRQLESGEFPGQIIPRARVGRDYDVRVTVDRATDVVVEGDAGDAVDLLIADAAGIADASGSGQLSAEVLDADNARAHAFLHADYESLAEISEAPMLETRLGSLLALRSSVNEIVGARPDGQRDLADTFPLSGVSARLDWLAGDGVLLHLEDVDVRDTGARQLTRVEWPIVPAGYGRPIVGFRQRPRSPAAVLRRTLRAIYSQTRNYQGTVIALPATHGGLLGNAGAAHGAPDAYSRASLPYNLDDVVRAYVNVEVITGAWVLEVNGVSTGIAVSAPGPIDIGRWLAAGAGRQTWARLITPNPATAASAYSVRLVILVKA